MDAMSWLLKPSVNNLTLKILAVLLAFLLWIQVASQETVQMTLTAPVESPHRRSVWSERASVGSPKMRRLLPSNGFCTTPSRPGRSLTNAPVSWSTPVPATSTPVLRQQIA